MLRAASGVRDRTVNQADKSLCHQRADNELDSSAFQISDLPGYAPLSCHSVLRVHALSLQIGLT